MERVQGGKRDKNQKSDPQNRLARLETLEERQLLTVAPSAVSTTGVYAEVLTNAADTIDLTSLKAGTNGASFEYVDAQGIKQTANNVTVVSASMNGVWRSGWYVVNSDVVLNDANVQCIGDVKLILADDCSLTVTGAEGEAGIGVSGGRLTVYGQTNGTGVLRATGGGGDKGAAGIGGDYNRFGGNVTINGGTVKAYCGERAAGIGGGGSKDGGAFSYGGNGSNIVVNGGNVEAHGGSKGAGTGGGNFYGAGEKITINGGIVKAYGSNSGSGIGGGNRGVGRKIVIKGGNVEAHGGSQGAGIGGGFDGYGENISIEGGFVKAYASNGGSAVGPGDGGSSSVSSVKITTASIVTAGDDAKSAKKIVNDGTDLAIELSGKKYVSVTPKVTTDASYVDAQNSASLASLTNLDIVFGTAQDEDWFI